MDRHDAFALQNAGEDLGIPIALIARASGDLEDASKEVEDASSRAFPEMNAGIRGAGSARL
jgi:hypothetical protein